LRICVSAEVAQAVVATGRVEGPVFTIPNGLDPAQPDHATESERPIYVLVAGLKQPELAEQIAERLVKDVTCRVLTSPLPRPHYLDIVASSRIAVFLPHAEEGFYLPALEAMQRKTLVICPDCRGNRSFCRDGDTCLMPVSEVEAIVGAVKQALALSASQRLAMCDRAYAVSTAFTLDAERRHFQTILRQSMKLWTESFGDRG
jgi:glycosyltransferase involved in cell wall biosynthesis